MKKKMDIIKSMQNLPHICVSFWVFFFFFFFFSLFQFDSFPRLYSF